MSRGAKDYNKDYTDPKLRERLKEEIKASDKGAAAGQWSARKSQLLTQEYERQGGGYRHPGRRTGGQRSLEEWTEQRWQTESGSATARHGDETERYLPEHAWEQLSPKQRRETKAAKRRASGKGKQRAANPPTAKAARKSAELDELSASEAVDRAKSLGRDEARRALEHERAHKGRKTVLRQLERSARE